MKDKLRFSHLGLVCVRVRWRNVSEDKILDKGNQDLKKITKFKSILKISIFFLN